MEDIRHMRLTSFQYKDDPQVTQYGLIAEEAPEPLQMWDKLSNRMNIKLFSQFAYAFAGIQLLDKRNVTLQTNEKNQHIRLSTLDQTISDLQNQLTRQSDTILTRQTQITSLQNQLTDLEQKINSLSLSQKL